MKAQNKSIAEAFEDRKLMDAAVRRAVREAVVSTALAASEIQMSEPHDPTFDPEAVLASLGLTLPTPPKPVAAYIPWRRSGNLIFTAGQVAYLDGKLMAIGSCPTQVSLETAQACARQCALNALAVVKSAVGSLSAVKQVVRVGVFVCSEAGFYDQPKVANGASELLLQIFGERGKHARAAVGSIALPLGSPVEVELVVEV